MLGDRRVCEAWRWTEANPVLLRARISACLERRRWRERCYLERIELEREKYEALLRNILPGQIIARLNDGEAVIADRCDRAAACGLPGPAQPQESAPTGTPAKTEKCQPLITAVGRRWR